MSVLPIGIPTVASPPVSCANGWRVAMVLLLLYAAAPLGASAQAVRTNGGFQVNSLGRNDDLSTISAVPLGFTINFFAVSYNATYVNNNGNITFGDSLPDFSSSGLIYAPLAIIAPFWADVDTLGSASSVVTYGTDVVNGRPAFGANYVDVGFFDARDAKLNSFQVVLIDRSDTGSGNFDIEFNYDRIIWETGDADFGFDGLGGISAATGYSNGTGNPAASFEVAGSGVPGSFLDSNPNGLVHRMQNSTVPGRLVFLVRNGSVACSYSLNSSGQSFGANGGTGSVSVVTLVGCGWTASSNASFVTITSGTPGSGSGVVNYSVAANSGGARSGTLTIAGQSFTVAQAGALCTYSLSPQGQSFSSVGGSGTVTVTAGAGCSWLAASSASFLTITSGASGTSNGSVGFSVAGNPGPELRSGSLSIAGHTFTVLQAGDTPLPPLSVSPARVDVAATVGSSTTRRSLVISSNSGNASWDFQWQRFSEPAGWLNVSPTSGTATTAQPSVVNVDFNPAGLAAGIYQGQITVRNSSSGATVAVIPVELTITASGPRLLLSQQSFLFAIQQGGAAPPEQVLQLVNGGDGNLNWAISLPNTQGFNIPLPTNGVAAAGTAGSSITLGVNPTGLGPGVYQNLFQVEAPGAADGMQWVTVTLHVVDPASPARVDLSPNGMIFVAEQGGAAPPAQTLAISNGGGGPGFSVSLAPSTLSGGTWLGTSASVPPPSVQLTADPNGLAPGIYRGKITVTSPQSPPQQEVEVVLVVAPAGAFQANTVARAACAPTRMDLVAISLGNGLGLPAGFPRTLLAQAVDDCGTLVNTATVTVAVDGLTIVLQAVGNGFYSGTWTPERASGALAVVFIAVHPTLGTVQRSYTVAISAAAGGASLPSVLPDGIVGAAAFPPRRPLAPGSIIAIFGSRLATAEAGATQVPLERSLNGTSVKIGNEDAPLYYAGPGQINAQLPFGVQPGQSVSVVVNAGGQLTAPQTYVIAPVQPAIFTVGDAGVVLNANGLITASNPAHIGDVLVIYANGLGTTNPAVNTGDPSPAAEVTNPVTVTVGGVQVPVQYQGLTPTLVGLNQINILLTGSVPTGENFPLVVTQNGVPSNTVFLSIH